MSELDARIHHCYDVNYTIDYFSVISPSSKNDIIAAFNYLAELYEDQNVLEKISHSAYVMCRYMKPFAEDVISLLLWRCNRTGKASITIYRQLFRQDRSDFYFRQTVDAHTNAPHDTGLGTDASIDYYVFMRVCDKMYAALRSIMDRKGIWDEYCVVRAYNLARKAHYGVIRKSGEPYLTHPISVATILADIGVESPIIAAALLHDVVEDTDYTINDIAAECGQQIAQYVDAVTSLHKEYAKSHISEEYTLDKNELDAKSFEKLVRAVHSEPRMVFALFIKAADRVHNLSTIDVTATEKQHDKTDETELDYLPLFAEFRLSYFVEWIKDLTWKVANPAAYQSFLDEYEKLYTRNTAHIESMKQTLIAHLGDNLNSLGKSLCDIAGYVCTVEQRKYRPLEVYNFVKRSIHSSSVSSKMVDKRTVYTCDFDIILDGKDARSTIDTFATLFVKLFSVYIVPSGRTITDFMYDSSERFIVTVEDRYRNRFRLCFWMRSNYMSFYLGFQPRKIPESDFYANELDEKTTIIVKLRDGKMLELPKGSTALDVAFQIHTEVGLCAKKDAIINGHTARISSILHDGDRVVIDTDTERKDGRVERFRPHARIHWLTFVKTRQAKNAIVRYLESQYEGDSSAVPVQDEVCNSAHHRLWDKNAGLVSSQFPNE